jgi:putative autoinducer-2 (AI-2) aldolase
MDWGLRNRLSRIIRPDGRTVMLAVDHGYFLGPTTGLEDAGKTIKPILSYADALMPTRGVLRTCVDPATDTPIVLRVSGGNSILDEDLSHEGITVSMEDAIRLNVSAVALSIYVGSANQKETLLNLTKLVDEGHRYGIPVLAVTAVGKNMGRDARYLALACRIAAELGAHCVKTYYCDDFEKVVKTCPVPVVMAGGKKLPEFEALELTYNAIRRGASGVDMGRNIFQSESPVAMIQAVRAVVHDNARPKEAYDLFNSLRKKAGAARKTKAKGVTASREELSRH